MRKIRNVVRKSGGFCVDNVNKICHNVIKGVFIMAQTNINIRIDENLKRQFDELCEELGLTMTTAINMFAKAMIREQGIPFEVSLHKPNAETVKAIEDAEKGIGLSKAYDTVEEAMKAMLEVD